MRTKRFIFGTRQSPCCTRSMLLVRSRRGGFISQNCIQCGKPSWVNMAELPQILCDHCGTELTVQKVDGQNYFYVCEPCGKQWMLGEVLPDWQELFEHCGLAAYGDGGLVHG